MTYRSKIFRFQIGCARRICLCVAPRPVAAVFPVADRPTDAERPEADLGPEEVRSPGQVGGGGERVTSSASPSSSEFGAEEARLFRAAGSVWPILSKNSSTPLSAAGQRFPTEETISRRGNRSYVIDASVGIFYIAVSQQREALREFSKLCDRHKNCFRKIHARDRAGAYHFPEAAVALRGLCSEPLLKGAHDGHHC